MLLIVKCLYISNALNLLAACKTSLFCFANVKKNVRKIKREKKNSEHKILKNELINLKI